MDEARVSNAPRCSFTAQGLATLRLVCPALWEHYDGANRNLGSPPLTIAFTSSSMQPSPGRRITVVSDQRREALEVSADGASFPSSPRLRKDRGLGVLGNDVDAHAAAIARRASRSRFRAAAGGGLRPRRSR